MKKVFCLSIGLVNFFLCGMEKQNSELLLKRSSSTPSGLTRSKRLDSGESSPRKTNSPRRPDGFPSPRFLKEENLRGTTDGFHPGSRIADFEKGSAVTEK